MVGMPGETPETVDETIAFLLEKKPIIGFVPVLYPLPSTRVYEEAKKNGTLQGDWDVHGSSPWIKLPWASSWGDVRVQANRIGKKVRRDPGTIWYFFKNHIRTMGWRQFKFLFRIALRQLRR